jgi:hypothetical protein
MRNCLLLSSEWAGDISNIVHCMHNEQTNAHLCDSLLNCSTFVALTCFKANASSSGSSIRCLLSCMIVLMESWWCVVKKLSHSLLEIVKTLKQ